MQQLTYTAPRELEWHDAPAALPTTARRSCARSRSPPVTSTR